MKPVFVQILSHNWGETFFFGASQQVIVKTQQMTETETILCPVYLSSCFLHGGLLQATLSIDLVISTSWSVHRYLHIRPVRLCGVKDVRACRKHNEAPIELQWVQRASLAPSFSLAAGWDTVCQWQTAQWLFIDCCWKQQGGGGGGSSSLC